MTRRTRMVAAALAAAWLTSPLAAQTKHLGSIDFPNSGAAAAQESFIRGVLLLHSFEYGPAASAFQEAQAQDPDFAMAYWGEAMTHNHPIWGRQNRDAAREILHRYWEAARDPRAEAATPREAMYLASLDELFASQGTKTERDEAYSDAMRRLHEAYPDDDEARAFYALSILGLTNGVRDFTNYMRGAAVAQPVFLANPQHPGAAHYLIHAFDDPVHAPLGLPAARAYGDAAPDAGHAQHMTSHIFLAMGMWDDVVRANINAVRVVDEARAARGMTEPNRCGHYPFWQHYGHLMREEWAEAEQIMEMCQANQANPDGDDRGYYAGTRARQVLDTRQWAAAETWTQDMSDAATWARVRYDFVTAYAALHLGDTAPAEQLLEEMAGWELEPRQTIMKLELEALLARQRGDTVAGVDFLREAAALEESLPMEFGPPASEMPPHELLGEFLLEVGQPAEAVAALEGALALTPRRTPTLRLLARAAQEAGMPELHEETLAEIQDIVR